MFLTLQQTRGRVCVGQLQIIGTWGPGSLEVLLGVKAFPCLIGWSTDWQAIWLALWLAIRLAIRLAIWLARRLVD